MATSDVDLVSDWWDNNPDDNVGINCAMSDLLALDFDSPAAFRRFSGLWQRHEGQTIAGSRIAVVKTTRPEGGWQMYFNNTDPPVGCPKNHQFGPDVDVKGQGGTVLAPGGTITGRSGTVELIQGDLGDLLDCRPWMSSLAQPKASASARYTQPRARWITPGRIQANAVLNEECRKIEHAPFGQQNIIINEAAWRLFHYCPPLNIEDVRAELEQAAERGNHPDPRAKATINSGLTHTWKKPVPVKKQKCPFRH